MPTRVRAWWHRGDEPLRSAARFRLARRMGILGGGAVVMKELQYPRSSLPSVIWCSGVAIKHAIDRPPCSFSTEGLRAKKQSRLQGNELWAHPLALFSLQRNLRRFINFVSIFGIPKCTVVFGGMELHVFATRSSYPHNLDSTVTIGHSVGITFSCLVLAQPTAATSCPNQSSRQQLHRVVKDWSPIETGYSASYMMCRALMLPDLASFVEEMEIYLSTEP
ncbi:hypothetical protein EJB05_53659, partial [Eragrostis curvula]